MTEAYVIGDSEAQRNEVRKILLQEGFDCPPENLFGLARADERLNSKLVPLVVVLLPNAPDQALEAIEQISRWPGREGYGISGVGDDSLGESASWPRLQGYRVLGVGSTADPKVVIQALRKAVDDFLDQAALDADLVQALARWQTLAHRLTQPGRVIAVVGPSGGCGSSTVAVNLATLMAQQHESSMLIDLHLATGDLAAMLDLKPEHTIVDLSSSPDRLDRELFKRVVMRHTSGVCLLAAPRTPEEAENITPASIRQIVMLARTLHPYVVLDLEYGYRQDQAELLRSCDFIAVVMRLDFISLRNTRRMIDHFERLGLPQERILLVVNRQGQARELPVDKVEEVLGLKITQSLPDDPRSVNQSNNCGVPVVIEVPSSKVSKGLGRLAMSMNGQPTSGAAKR